MSWCSRKARAGKPLRSSATWAVRLCGSSPSRYSAGPLAELGHDLRGCGLDLRVGHGLVPRLQRHRDRDRLLAGLDPFALVDVEHGDIGDELAIDALRRAQDVGGLDRAIDHEGEVSLHRLKR